MPEDMLSDAERHELGDRIDRLRRAKRLTLAELASKAGYDERTARNIIQGRPTRFKTLQHFCEAIGLPSHKANNDVAEFADEEHGGYSLKSFKPYIGHYAAFRWSYSQTTNIMKTCISLSWSSEKGIIFSEHQKYKDGSGRLQDFSQVGGLYCNEEAGLIHLVTIVEGMVRLMTLTRLQRDGILRGAVLSQAKFSLYRRPAVSPIFLQKLPKTLCDDELESFTAELSIGDTSFDEASEELKAIERDILLSTVGLDRDAPRRRQSDFSGVVTQLSSVR